MRLPSLAGLTFLAGSTPLLVGAVCGQDYPNKPLRIVTGSPGGGTDFAARLIAQGLAGFLGQPVIVDNRGGIIPIDIVSKALPDGYTLLIDGATFRIGPLIEKTFYDPVRDFLPITLTSRTPNVVVVYPALPAKSIKELIALAKAKPGELNYASTSIGASSHLAAELFKSMADVNIVRVPYKAGATAITELIGGQVHLYFAAGTVVPHLKAGRLRALAVTSAKPSAIFPELPTVAASGVPGYEASQLSGIFAPVRTPVPLVQRLNQEIVRVLNQAEVKEKFFNAGAEIVASTPAQQAATMKSEMVKWDKVIKAAGKLE